MIIPSVGKIRKDLVPVVATHIMARPSLYEGLQNPLDTSRRLVLRWRDVRCGLIWILIRHENRWTTLGEAGKHLGLNQKEAEGQWHQLHRIIIQLNDGQRARLFRKGIELRFRHHGTVDGKRVRGGILLHLQHQDRLNYRSEVSITETIEPSLITHTVSYNESLERQADSRGLSPAEREALIDRRGQIIKGPQGEQLSMFSTGTDGRRAR